ncbi:MAG: gliding motility-associated C-terminal domain-containing protein [Bacteroidetes bacterium]|nr:gliding motility-associated C-terminal domain-containing protein [Bacteroidota bacterium]
MRKTLITYFLTQLFLLNFAQDKTFNNWHFGSNNIMSFNTTPPSVSNNSGMYSVESCSSISDTLLGNTLFYTNGVDVFDRANNQMPNGFGLNGHPSSTCGALIVPFPFNPRKYYIFTVDAQVGNNGATPTCNCLCYSVVDMNLNSGWGDVAVKNVLIRNSMTEKMAGYWHANDSAIWVVTHEWNSNHFLSYLVTSSGVNSIPVVSAIGSVHSGGLFDENAIGQMKISPDGTKIACVKKVDNTLELFKFDNTNGTVYDSINVLLKPYYNETYGVEFSPNSNNVYMGTGKTNQSYLVQYNLSTWNANTILSSSYELIGTNTGRSLGQLELGPDKKIYVANRNINTLSVINFPDSNSAACGFTYDQIAVNFPNLGLPIHVPRPTRSKIVKDTTDVVPNNSCDVPIVPNIVTPNNDGTNDEFKITCNGSFEFPEDLIIYNRWGQEVYNAKKKDSLNKLSDGTYYYLFSFHELFYKGYVTIVH